MNIKGTNSQSKCLLKQGNDTYLINLNDGFCINKDLFMLWLKPKKAIRLSKHEEELLSQSSLFKSGVPLVAILGISIFILGVASGTLTTLELKLNRLLLSIITIIIPILFMITLKKSSLKDSEIISNILGRSITWDSYVVSHFEKKSDKSQYILRVVIGFIITLALIGVGFSIFIYNGMLMGLVLYAAALYALLGTSCIIPNKATIKEKVDVRIR